MFHLRLVHQYVLPSNHERGTSIVLVVLGDLEEDLEEPKNADLVLGPQEMKLHIDGLDF